MIIILLIGFTGISNSILIFIFACSTFLPFLIFFIVLKNTGTSRIQILKIISGAILIVSGFLVRPEITTEVIGIPIMSVYYMSFIAPILSGIGILLIFTSFRIEAFGKSKS